MALMTRASCRIALLGARGVPTVSYYLAELRRMFYAVGQTVEVILNDKTESEKDLAIWTERTGGKLPYREPTGSGNKVIGVPRINGAAELLAEYDLAINGGCLEILKPPALTAPRLGILNVHPGLLPDQRGASAPEWGIYYDEPIGITAHIMDEGIDTGPIVVSTALGPFPKTFSYQDIRSVIYHKSFEHAAKAAKALLAGQVTPGAQQGGQTRGPIPPDEMAEVLRKIGAGEYRHQV